MASPLRLRLLWAAVAVTGLTLDVVTKVIAVSQIDPGAPVRLLGGLLTLRLIRNPGAAFSQGQGFTAVFAVAAIGVLGLRHRPPRSPAGPPRLGRRPGFLVCRGQPATWSTDCSAPRRVLRGHVVDFLQLPYWPIFNVADMCISTAAVMIVILAIIKNVGVDGERHGRD